MHAPLRDQGLPRRSTRLAPAALDAMALESPSLVYDLDVVSARVAEFRSAFSERVSLHYAVKCNPDPQVLQRVREGGGSFEIASLGELLEVTALGASAEEVLFSNPVKPPSHIASAYAAGVRLFAVDSVEEVAKIAEHAPGAEVYVRLRVDDSSSQFPLSSKFGTPYDAAVRLLLRARALGLIPAGLTFHVGSQCSNPQAWAHAIELCAPLMDELTDLGIHLTMLDIGGGFAADYGADKVPTLQEVAWNVLPALERLPYLPERLMAEPGRAIVAEAATLATTVIGRTERDGRPWVYLDVGAYNGLMEAAQTSGRMAFPLATSRHGDPRTIRCTVTGPSCDSSDTLFKDAELPASTAVGDRLYIGSAGAYSLCYASPFNGFPIPVPVYLP